MSIFLYTNHNTTSKSNIVEILPKLIATIVIFVWAFTIMFKPSPLEWLTYPSGIFCLVEVLIFYLTYLCISKNKQVGKILLGIWFTCLIAYCAFSIGAIFSLTKLTAIESSLSVFKDYSSEVSIPLAIHIFFFFTSAYSVTKNKKTLFKELPH